MEDGDVRFHHVDADLRVLEARNCSRSWTLLADCDLVPSLIRHFSETWGGTPGQFRAALRALPTLASNGP